MPAPSRYAVAADVVVVAETPTPSVLLIRRRNPPLGWAIPGGFVEPDEDLIDAARRELFEETGLQPAELEQLATFGHPNRDPRGRTISVVYGARLQHAALPAAGDDAADARWFPLTTLPTTLAFDHPTILAQVLPRLVRAFKPEPQSGLPQPGRTP
ncbi:MAG: NUDIX hydrolase [Chloroflexota bacterium]|nr:NUDIX hydrolase [Chloroflexota bacterium]